MASARGQCGAASRGQSLLEATAPGAGRMARGQSSLEAMLAFAALLCALAVLAHAARAQSDAFSSSVEKANARVALAREALYIDLASDSLPGAALMGNLSGVPVSGGAWLASSSSGAVREPLLHTVTADSGGNTMQTRKDSKGMAAKGAGRRAGFWSIDAAFALVLSVAVFAIFSAILHAAGASVARGAEDASGELLSARFSSYALARLEAGGEVDLQSLLARTGRGYASLRAGSGFSEAGARGGSAYCTARLALIGGNITRVEACIG